MSKSNVNPNHYKVAGRERQGEDIPQIRNKQTHAESVVRRRAERAAGVQKAVVARSAPPARAALPDTLAPTAKTATRKTRATPLQTPPGHKRGHTLVPGSTAPHARFAKTKPAAILPPTGTIPRRTPTQATRKSRVNLPSADQRGRRSTTAPPKG